MEWEITFFFPSPSGPNRGRDVRVLGNLIYILSLKAVGSLDGIKILLFLIIQSQQSPAFLVLVSKALSQSRLRGR